MLTIAIKLFSITMTWGFIYEQFFFSLRNHSELLKIFWILKCFAFKAVQCGCNKIVCYLVFKCA